MTSIGFKHYWPNFEKEGVDGLTLSTITEFDLQQLGMRIRERKLFTSHLYTLHAEHVIRKKKHKMMKKVFTEYDLDKSGKLTKDEFCNAWLDHTSRHKRSSHMLRKIAGHGVDHASKK